MIKKLSKSKWIFSLSLLAFSFNLFSQTDPKLEVTKNYFIKNAWVVSKPGASPVMQSVLIKDGIISQMGSLVKPTFDSKVIDVDSMYLYAGFIDAMSNTGIKKEEEKKDAPKPPSRGQATLEQSGITPQVNALAKFSNKESSIGDMRKAGFTVSHVFPKGKMMAGSSILVNLKDVDHEDKMILSQNLGMHSSFTTASGVVPSTVIAVIAKYKDIYRNADISIKNMQAYNANPLGIKKPSYSEEISALIPIVKKELPVYFVAENSKDIFRAINLQKELGYKMILSNVKQSQYALDLIKANGYSVLLSLDLPDEIKDEEKKEDSKKQEDKKPEDKKEGDKGQDSKKQEDKTQDNKKQEEKGQDSKSQEDKKQENKKEEKPKKELTEEEKALLERKKKSLEDYNKQAANLEKNGVPFSFSYIDVKPGDALKSVKRFIKAGLSESAALAALTTTPASMLGIAKTNGTVETGKVASLVLSDKPIFEEKAEIKYVIVDGQIFDYQEKKKSDTKVDAKGAKIEGNWSYTVEIPGNPQTGSLTFEKDGDGYKGTSKSDSDPEIDKIENISIDGEKVTFTMTIDMGQPTDISFDLVFTGDTYKGTVNVGPMGVFPISGSKTSPKQ